MSRRHFFLPALALLHLSIASPVWSQESSLPPRDQFHLFLLAGQSNMAGRGTITANDKIAHPRILMLNKEDRWVPAVDPLHFDKTIAGVGLGRTFAMAIAAANPGVTIGLIPCAVGGSPIDTWQTGAFYSATKTHPWDDALRRAEVALKSGTLKGILWHQGESDSTPELAPKYESKLHDLIRRFRTELRAPDAPFIVGELGRFSDAPWSHDRQTVGRVHRELPRKINHTAFVSAEGLNHKGDKVHFDADSYREFGQRYAAAYLKLTAGK